MATVLLGAVAPGWAADADDDGVDDAVDACSDTEIPEGMPTKALLPLHYALTDADTTFNTFKGKESSFTTADTAGCSCTQIIALSGLGSLASKVGCNRQVMESFIAGLHAAPLDPGQQFPATGQTTSYAAGDDGDIQAGAALSYTDNGNGTITDNNTGLMWEKKSDDGTIHNQHTTYTWANAFAVHIAGLNTANFAGHNDWRLPNAKELMSIVNYENDHPAVPSAFNNNCTAACSVTTCSCTLATLYWSSTSSAFNPSSAWYVLFSDGSVNTFFKDTTQRVRAVRGGQ
jgi:hypothetical protein